MDATYSVCLTADAENTSKASAMISRAAYLQEFTMTSSVLPEVDLKSLPGVRQFDLTGHVAIITGGSKGLGAAIAAGRPLIAGFESQVVTVPVGGQGLPA